MCERCPQIDYEDDTATSDQVDHGTSWRYDYFENVEANDPLRYNQPGCTVHYCVACESGARGVSVSQIYDERSELANRRHSVSDFVNLPITQEPL